MKKAKSVLLGSAMAVGLIVGFLYGHGDVQAFFSSSSWDLVYSAAKTTAVCPGGSTPKCVSCYGGGCNWSCRGGYYCNGTGSACSVVGVSCGGTTGLYDGYGF